MTIEPAVRRRLHELADLVPGPELDATTLDITGEGAFASAFDVDGALLTAAAAVNLAFGVPTVDRARLVALCAGRALVDGEQVPAWADLSGYYRTRDGELLQLHANFPHHAAGVVERLGVPSERDAVRAAVLEHDADELEATLIADGMIAARVRSLDEWAEHPHARATAHLPLVSVERLGDAPPRRHDRRRRVLDCSRVLAGPIAGLQFAAHGADVLRVGSAALPSVEIGVLITGSGKRNAFVELTTPTGRALMRELLDGADVWIDAYRPGALAGRGFPPAAAAAGSVVVQISAFDWVGPWAGRRGFDSIVQSTSGIVHAGTVAAGADRPVPLPVQALDHATGLLAAFVAERLVRHQADTGGTWLARLSLLRTRNWLVAGGGPTPFEPETVEPHPDALHTVDTPFGAVTTARPIGGAWPHGPRPLGADEPRWLDR